MPQIPEESKEHLGFAGFIYVTAKSYEDTHKKYNEFNTKKSEKTRKDMKDLQAVFEASENKDKLQKIAEMASITQQRELDVWSQKMDKYKE